MEIRSARSDELESISAYLAGALHGEASRYRRFLDYTWLDPKPQLGIVLEDGGKIRGFVGTIYSERTTGRYCNLTSIAVDESHRRHTLKLFGMALAAKDVTYTCFSASEQVAKILEFFKFKQRPSERVLVGPLTESFHRARVILSPDQSALDDAHRVIARDHRSYDCGQLLIVRGNRRCFAVTVKRGHGLRVFADVLYASDPALLLNHVPQVQLALLRRHRTLLLGIDRAWVATAPRLSLTYRGLRPVHLRSSTVTDVDLLYSELVPMYG